MKNVLSRIGASPHEATPCSRSVDWWTKAPWVDRPAPARDEKPGSARHQTLDPAGGCGNHIEEESGPGRDVETDPVWATPRTRTETGVGAR